MRGANWRPARLPACQSAIEDVHLAVGRVRGLHSLRGGPAESGAGGARRGALGRVHGLAHNPRDGLLGLRGAPSPAQSAVSCSLALPWLLPLPPPAPGASPLGNPPGPQDMQGCLLKRMRTQRQLAHGRHDIHSMQKQAHTQGEADAVIADYWMMA